MQCIMGVSVYLGCLSISVTIPSRILPYVLIVKFKALLVVRRIVLWQILYMDNCVYVVHLFYMRVHACFDATHVFCFCTHGKHTRTI